MRKYSSLSMVYHGLIIITFVASFGLFFLTAVMQGAADSLMRIPFDPVVISRFRVLATVILVIYYLLALPRIKPLYLLILTLMFPFIVWAIEASARAVFSMVIEAFVLGALMSVFFIGLFGIFFVLFFDLISGVAAIPFFAAGAAVAASASSVINVTGLATDSIGFPYRQTCKYLGLTCMLLLLTFTGSWYDDAWNKSDYEQGVALMEQGDYAGARDYLGRVGYYRDGRDRWSECIEIIGRTDAVIYMENADYEQAAVAYNIAGNKYLARRARILAAQEKGDLSSVTSDLIGVLREGDFEVTDIAEDYFSRHFEYFKAGDNYYIGTYQDNEGETRMIPWIVYKTGEDLLLLISARNFPAMRLSEKESCRFADSELYEYLNSEFSDVHFTADELSSMVTLSELYTDSAYAEYTKPVFLPSTGDMKYLLESVPGAESIVSNNSCWLRDRALDGTNYYMDEKGKFRGQVASASKGIRPMIIIEKRAD
ncbi:MAG: hypothetical protein MJ175_05465 [Clostridia bacterium]|nr:hypothetical protein [Clostridia bacterium]